MAESPNRRAGDIAALLERAAADRQAGRLADAEAACRAALALDPDHPVALNNLGAIRAQGGDPQAAVEIFDRLLAAEPAYVSAHLNRAGALRALGRTEAAIQGYRTVVALEPDHHGAHRALGFLWLAAGRRDRALDHFARTYDLRRGEGRIGIAEKSLRTASPLKLRHDAALFRHLPPRARDGQRFEILARLYDSVAAELPHGETVLSDAQLERLGPDYNTGIHVIDAPELPGGAVNPRLDGAALKRRYRDAEPGMVWFDDLLAPKALALLQRFLRESTIWHDFSHIDGFVAAYLEDGLASPLVLQIADEFRALLPDLLGALPLSQAWAFKGVRGERPVDIHADDAAISLNFWVTPDAANRDPATGGLAVCRTRPPEGWKMTGYDEDTARIRTFLDAHGAEIETVPYRENRAVLFESRLFHGSDAPDFATGYADHRINITMLFGDGKNM